jgi:hypothetical protein
MGVMGVAHKKGQIGMCRCLAGHIHRHIGVLCHWLMLPRNSAPSSGVAVLVLLLSGSVLLLMMVCFHDAVVLWDGLTGPEKQLSF